MARIVAPPPGCQPRGLHHARGLVVLTCSTGAAGEIYAATADGRWRLEHAAVVGNGDADALEIAEDGTALLLVGRTGSPTSHAYVRRPELIGAPSLWREVTERDAIAYVVHAGGAVDVVTAAPGDGQQSFSIVEHRSDGRRVLAVDRQRVVGDLWCVGRIEEGLVGLVRREGGTFERVSIDASGVRVTGRATDGRGHLDPRARCGL